MKVFITALFLFCTIALFAQPQKGDIYVGFSNLNIISSQQISRGFSNFRHSALFLAPTFGKFITNNTLLSGGITFSTSLRPLFVSTSSSSTFSPSRTLGLNLLCAQYFGKGKLRGLGQLTFNSNLTRNEFTDTKRSLTSNFEFGGAYFANDFTSLQLLYSLNIFSASEGLDTEYFTSGIKPNLGLSIRTLLLRNREGIEDLSALNSIKKGATAIGLSGRYRNVFNTNSLSLNGELTYFLANNLYLSATFSSFSSKSDINLNNNSGSFFSLSGGRYMRIVDGFYVKLSTGFRNESQFRNFILGGIEEFENNQHTIRWNTEIGVAFFLGNHKLEPGLDFRVSNTRIKEVDMEWINDTRTSLFVNYEWFLAQNFALSGSANFRFNEVFYFPFNNITTILGIPVGPGETIVQDFAQNNISLNFGFKWYLSTPME